MAAEGKAKADKKSPGWIESAESSDEEDDAEPRRLENESVQLRNDKAHLEKRVSDLTQEKGGLIGQVEDWKESSYCLCAQPNGFTVSSLL